MSGFAPLRPLLLVLLACASTPLAAETRIEAPGGVAAQNITNSPISIGLSPDEQIHLVEVFLQRNAVTDEARAKAEARASELGAQLGFTREAVIGFFRILGEQDVSPEQISLKLGEIAARHRAMLDRWSVLDTADPSTAALAAEAKAAIDSGRYDQADALLVQTEEQDAAAARQAEQLARDAQQAAERRWLNAAEKEGKRGDLAMTRLRYADAALRYAAAANTVPTSRQDARLGYLEQEAGALYHQGDERGDNTAASLTIDRYRALARATDHTTAPREWAMTQNNLGNALLVLGERESETARLEQAIVAFRAALQVWTRDQRPLDWAMAEMNLGHALWVLGDRESGTAQLEEAIGAYRAALQEWTRDRVPLEWAMTETNLGGALVTLGERESGTARLDEAVTAFSAALQEQTRERAPLDWATAELNLGNALLMLVPCVLDPDRFP
jgi:tetratricopeptide (TPR) repeat protein